MVLKTQTQHRKQKQKAKQSNLISLMGLNNATNDIEQLEEFNIRKQEIQHKLDILRERQSVAEEASGHIGYASKQRILRQLEQLNQRKNQRKQTNNKTQNGNVKNNANNVPPILPSSNSINNNKISPSISSFSSPSSASLLSNEKLRYYSIISKLWPTIESSRQSKLMHQLNELDHAIQILQERHDDNNTSFEKELQLQQIMKEKQKQFQHLYEKETNLANNRQQHRQKVNHQQYYSPQREKRKSSKFPQQRASSADIQTNRNNSLNSTLKQQQTPIFQAHHQHQHSDIPFHSYPHARTASTASTVVQHSSPPRRQSLNDTVWSAPERVQRDEIRRRQQELNDEEDQRYHDEIMRRERHLAEDEIEFRREQEHQLELHRQQAEQEEIRQLKARREHLEQRKDMELTMDRQVRTKYRTQSTNFEDDNNAPDQQMSIEIDEKLTQPQHTRSRSNAFSLDEKLVETAPLSERRFSTSTLSSYPDEFTRHSTFKSQQISNNPQMHYDNILNRQQETKAADERRKSLEMSEGIRTAHQSRLEQDQQLTANASVREELKTTKNEEKQEQKQQTKDVEKPTKKNKMTLSSVLGGFSLFKKKDKSKQQTPVDTPAENNSIHENDESATDSEDELQITKPSIQPIRQQNANAITNKPITQSTDNLTRKSAVDSEDSDEEEKVNAPPPRPVLSPTSELSSAMLLQKKKALPRSNLVTSASPAIWQQNFLNDLGGDDIDEPATMQQNTTQQQDEEFDF